MIDAGHPRHLAAVKSLVWFASLAMDAIRRSFDDALRPSMAVVQRAAAK
jgi:hypothetical protein